MRDMIPPGDRSIRNIPIPRGHQHIQREDIPEYYQPEPPAPRGRSPQGRSRRRPGRFVLWALAIIVVCAGTVAGVSMLYAGAVVHVTPRIETLTASTTLVAQINAPVGTLSYTVLTATRHATATVPATGTKKVSRVASGTVTISSTYSASQRLIANTRLEATDGKIYRLASSVDLPANGSVTATVNAESPGEAYNRSSATTFKLPGFKGDPRYDVFSAKSQGAITGGFVGDEPAVAEADLEAARAELKAKLDNEATRSIAQEVPDASMVLSGSEQAEYGELVQTSSADKKSAIISQSATMSAAVASIRDVASALAGKLVSDYGGEAVDFKDRENLDIQAAPQSPDDEQLQLTAKGSFALVWQFDPNALQEAMLGRNKSEFQDIVDSFAPAIVSATATIRPFWIKNFPAEAEKISIEIAGVE